MKYFYVYLRDLHLYFGLFVSPFVLLFAVTTLLFNHTWKPWESDSKTRKIEMPVTVPADVDGVEQAKAILRQVGVTGEIRNIIRRRNRLEIPVMKPGRETSIRVDLETGMASVEQRETGVWDALMYLHKSPGPHLAQIRGNWVFTRIWRHLVDAVVYVILFLTASGIYLWAVIKAERKIGLIAMGAGCLAFLALVAMIAV